VTIKVQVTTQGDVRVGFSVRMNNISQALAPHYWTSHSTGSLHTSEGLNNKQSSKQCFMFQS